MDFALKSDIGQMRPLNEDYCGYYYNEDADMALFVLADGMGGHNASEVASKLAVDNIIKHISVNIDADKISDNTNYIIELIEGAIKLTNSIIYEMAYESESLDGMGTTLVILAICKSKGYIANIGDSRAYLIDKTKIKQLTTDHSYIEELLRKGTISKEAAMIHPQRNIITRAVGTDLDVVADYTTININKGDVLLLCSDGLSNVLKEVEIKEIVVSSQSAEEASDRLLKEANQKGGYDNISVVVVKI